MKPSPRRVLLVELQPWHEENFLHWSESLSHLGCAVDIYARASVHRKRALDPCSSSNVRLLDLERLPVRAEGYDLVVINSLMGPGFDRFVASRYKPMLRYIAGLETPWLAVIHEPTFWTDQYPAQTFHELVEGKQEELHLQRCGSWHRPGEPWQPGTWELSETELRLWRGRREERFSSEDGGISYQNRARTKTLIRTRSTPPSLGSLLESGAGRVLTLSPQGAHHLRAHYGDVQWIHPGYFGDLPVVRSPFPRIAVPGCIDYARRSFSALFSAARELRALGLPIYFVGGHREAEAWKDSPVVRRLVRDLDRHGLRNLVRLTGPLPYRRYFEFVQSSSFVMPLVDETTEGGAYRTKLSTSIALAIAFGVPLIVNRGIVEPYGLTHQVRYQGDDLVSGLRVLRRGWRQPWASAREELVKKHRELNAHSRKVLRGVFEALLAGSRESARGGLPIESSPREDERRRGQPPR